MILILVSQTDIILQLNSWILKITFRISIVDLVSNDEPELNHIRSPVLSEMHYGSHQTKQVTIFFILLSTKSI